MGRSAPPIHLLPRQRSVLEELSRSRTLERRLAERVEIVLGCADGKTTVEVAASLGVDPQRVARWRRRFSEAAWRLAELATAADDEGELEAAIVDFLGDEERCGCPPKFTAVQLTDLIALACQDPKELSLPVTHWTPRSWRFPRSNWGSSSRSRLATSRVFLEEADLRPHRSSYWLNPRIDDPAAHQASVERICEVYQQAPELAAQGTHVVSSDEKTGIQALERAAPTKPTRPGLVERREFEYIRHGTLCLTANFEVATGKVIAPTVGPTRSEQDFLQHIQQTVATDPEAGWIFVVDNLNTHCSESLVRWVAQREHITGELGEKGKEGLLHNVASRAAFLSDSAHRVRFVYTPKHCSWLNQVEIWFSVLSRRALKRASFASLDELRDRLLGFIEYFNRLLAKPYRWTYKGRPLAA